ncbi:8-amino-7-oxononanoate synthase [Mariprofundus sp. NF]|uniref:aminotransferase class I/II-fold pyridoxal phosphate-dependent enzyme n=1 Tax=Mariprofundus sp. NF TaxID=2608716 RepID=UPI0015A02F65|nr:8-amino-7-oxononanoate synthase [Mariprofundus sp. NF]NWF38926.1 8-amino-7-oxononanoate synthase [Mariprofundus sp. NF]
MPDSRNWFPETPATRRRRLTASRRQGMLIHLDGEQLINFASNDYLGLSFHPAVCMGAKGALDDAVGSGASRLISGDDPMLHRLEEKLAAWKGYESCLIVGSGMLANIGLIQALADRHSHLFADKLNHASLVDGARLAGGQSHRFKHLDSKQLSQLLEKHPAEKRIIVSDGIFSMDGDCADAAALLGLAEANDTLLLIDDAHGIGCMGPEGRGITARDNISGHPRLIEVGTFGKAFGSYGAFILGTDELIEGLRQRQRTLIYSTALPVAMIAAAETALLLIQRGQQLQQLRENLALFKEKTAGLGFMASSSPIQPLIIGSDEKALQLAAALRENGFFVPAIRPPTVPEGTARLRFTITAAHSREQIEKLTACLRELL